MTGKILCHAEAATGYQPDWDALRQAQKDLAFSQFHDVLPGTAIKPVEEDSLRTMAHGEELADKLFTQAFFKLCDGQEKAPDGQIPIMAYNPHPYPITRDFEVGFMLANQKIHGWKIEKTIFAAECDSQWGFQDSFMRPNGRPFVFDDHNETMITLDVHKIIARRMTQDTFPSAVYRLQPRDPNAKVATIRFQARIKRGCDDITKAEYLELLSLNQEGEAVDYTSQYELAVCQGDELFWQDSGCVVS
jgi:hypothetical protein